MQELSIELVVCDAVVACVLKKEAMETRGLRVSVTRVRFALPDDRPQWIPELPLVNPSRRSRGRHLLRLRPAGQLSARAGCNRQCNQFHYHGRLRHLCDLRRKHKQRDAVGRRILQWRGNPVSFQGQALLRQPQAAS